MQITPGYDFSVNEIPTAAKFGLMATGMSVTGIALAQIDTTLVGVRQSDTSDISLPSEGWLWNDHIGSLWVQGRNGPVKLFRANWGGWESRRYPCGKGTTDYGLPQPMATAIGYVGALSMVTDESNVRFHYSRYTTYNNWLCKALDTAVSEAYVRFIGRGGCMAQMYYAPLGYAPAEILIDLTYSGLREETTYPPTTGTTKWGIMLRGQSKTMYSMRAAWFPGLAYHED